MFDHEDYAEMVSIAHEESMEFAEMVELELIENNHWKGKSIIFLDDNHFRNLMNFLKRNNHIDDDMIDKLTNIRTEKISKALETIDEDINFISRLKRVSDYFTTEIANSISFDSDRALNDLKSLKSRYNR